MVAPKNRTLLNNFLSQRSKKSKRSQRSQRSRRSAKTAKRYSTVGKILPPLDVRKEKDLIPLMNRIKSGPITIILVYADWCSHCHSFKPKFDAAARKRTLPYPVAYVEDSMLSMANEKLKSLNGSPNTLSVQGYPTVIAVSNKGQMVKKSIPQETSIKMMNETPMNEVPVNKASMNEVPPMNTPMNTSMNTPMNEVPVNTPMNTPMNEVHPVVEPVAVEPVEPVVVKSIPSYKPSLENLPMVTNTKLNEGNRNQGNQGNRNQGSQRSQRNLKKQQTQPIFEAIPMKGGNPTVPKYLGGGLLDKLSKTPYQLGSFDKLVAKLKQRK
jgi:thiol-disulfide isomerase/thioredoxin